MKPVRVYYLMCGTDGICSEEMTGTEGKTVRFMDGGWNPIEDCYLTEKQCRDAHQMPFPNPSRKKRITGILKRLETLETDLREEVEQTL